MNPDLTGTSHLLQSSSSPTRILSPGGRQRTRCSPTLPRRRPAVSPRSFRPVRPTRAPAPSVHRGPESQYSALENTAAQCAVSPPAAASRGYSAKARLQCLHCLDSLRVAEGCTSSNLGLTFRTIRYTQAILQVYSTAAQRRCSRLLKSAGAS